MHLYTVINSKSVFMKNPAEMSDEKLIQFYLNGNPNAMSTLVELYKDKIYGSVFSMVQDKYAAEEIFREVFVVIINNLIAGKTTEEGSFLQWALSIGHQLCIEHTRKTKMALVVDINKDTLAAGPVDFSVSTAQPEVDYYESHNKIKSMISLLPDEQREVVALKHYAGLSFAEIAGIMKCSLTAALDLMHFGLNNLRKQMMEKEMLLQ
jgi:RNA polymerase sigma factor (sigma-70 family)